MDTGVRGTSGIGRAAGAILLGAKWGGDVRIHELGSGKPTSGWRDGASHRNSVTTLALAPNDALAVTGAKDGDLRLWDVRTGACFAVYAGHRDAVWDVSVSPDGAWLLSASADGDARLWPTDLLATARSLNLPTVETRDWFRR